MTGQRKPGGLPEGDVLPRVLSLLGWGDLTVVNARAWSAVRLVACELDQAEHERRAAAGVIPVTDPLLLKCVAAEQPEFMVARPPVRIVGAIALRRKWRTAVGNLAGFGAFGARVAVLPARQADRLDVAAGAMVEGYGVIASDCQAMRLVHHPDLRPRPGSRTWVHRLVEEIVYDALLVRGECSRPVRAATGPTSSAGSPAVSSRPSNRG